MDRARSAPAASGGSRPAAPVRPPDFAPVEEFLQLLARAIRQFHTYPATSPLCVDAVVACRDALAGLGHRERLSARVTPQELIVEEVSVGAGTIIEHELTRRLHKVRVASLRVDRGATPRDVTRFCLELLQFEDQDQTRLTFAERLADHGVEAIVPGMAHRPAVLDVGTPTAPVRDLVAHERKRHAELLQPDAPVSYLYPPDKGWIRLDPSETTLDTVSLTDLAVLVEDPADVAAMLLRLTDDDAGGPDMRQAALARKFSDVSTLLSALDPRLARVLFGRLARAVLDLDPERRKALLERTILPGLLDGKPDGSVLRDFPDVDLADSLFLLLDLEAAAPQMLSAVLERLDLTQERREALVPLIDERLRRKQSADEDARRSGIERYARELIRVTGGGGRDYSAFAAFDLSVDAPAEAAIAGVRDGIGTTDVPAARLQCVAQLVRLEPNPALVEGFLRRARTLFEELERAQRWPDLASTLVGYGQLEGELLPRRPDVAAAITSALADFCTPTRLVSLVDLHQRDAEGREIASRLLTALGTAIVPGYVALLDDSTHQAKARAITPLMCERATTLAPALELALGTCGVAASRGVVKVLGFAGAGHEAAVARLVDHSDEQLGREALRALARIGSPTAAAIVMKQIQEGTPGRRAAAEEALWHFPASQTTARVRELLRSHDFVVRQPDTAARLLERAAQTRAGGLDDVLVDLEGFRFRFWQPGLMRVARKARELRAR